VGFSLFLLAFELRRQGVGTAGLGLSWRCRVGGVVGAFLLPRAARLVREDGLLAGGLLLCGTTAWLLAGRVGVAAAAAGGLAMGAGIAAARLGLREPGPARGPPAARGTAITRAETTFQLAWVAGAVLPVALPLPTTPALLVAAVACLAAAATYYRRPAPPAPGSPPYPSARGAALMPSSSQRKPVWKWRSVVGPASWLASPRISGNCSRGRPAKAASAVSARAPTSAWSRGAWKAANPSE
jgi:hypothetical protein